MGINDLYGEYDALLIGNRKNISSSFFNMDPTRNMKNALAVIKYSFVTYLRWTPETLSAKLDKRVMEKLRLIPFMKYIKYPIEYDKNKDWYYLVSLLFKSESLDLRAMTIHTYEKILAGEKAKYPKDWFIGNDGLVRAGICLQYMISSHLSFNDVNDLYALFASEEGYRLLERQKLLQACKDAFETPVDYVNFIIPLEERDDFLFRYYKYKYQKEMLNQNGRKRRPTMDYKLEV